MAYDPDATRRIEREKEIRRIEAEMRRLYWQIQSLRGY